MTKPAEGLRNVALRGGSYLAFREMMGMAIRLGGVVALTRIIGPHDYGVYVAAAAFTGLVASLAQLGAEVYLIRQPTEPTVETYNQAFSALLVVALVTTVTALGLTWPVGMLLHQHSEITAFRIMVLAVPVNILWAPAQARIERHFHYKRMAWVELAGDFALYGTAVPLALLGLGYLAPAVGYVAWQTTLFITSALAARLWPRWRWSKQMFFALTHHGVSYSSNTWIDQLAGLINPVIVGALVGATGVGLVGLALRLVDTAGFALRAAWRLGVAAISRLVDQPERLRSGLEEGMLMLVIALGLPLASLAVLSPWLLPLVFGRAWTPVAALYGILALGRLATSVTMPQVTLLFVEGQMLAVAKVLMLGTMLMVAASTVFVSLLGIDGYAIAQLVSAIVFVLIDRKVRPRILFSYRKSVKAIAALGAPMLTPFFPWPWRLVLCVPALALAAIPDVRHSLLNMVRSARSSLVNVKGPTPRES